MAESHLYSLAVIRFADRDMLMRHFGHGIGHLEHARVHEGVWDEGAGAQETEYQNGEEEEGDNVMDLDGEEDDEDEGEPTDESSDGEDDEESGYASF